MIQLPRLPKEVAKEAWEVGLWRARTSRGKGRHCRMRGTDDPAINDRASGYGALGEAYVANYYGVPWTGTSRFDIEAKGDIGLGNTQVRTTTRTPPYLNFYDGNDPDAVYILVWVCGRVWWLVGWAHGHEIVEQGIRENIEEGGTFNGYRLAFSSLHQPPTREQRDRAKGVTL